MRLFRLLLHLLIEVDSTMNHPLWKIWETCQNTLEKPDSSSSLILEKRGRTSKETHKCHWDYLAAKRPSELPQRPSFPLCKYGIIHVAGYYAPQRAWLMMGNFYLTTKSNDRSCISRIPCSCRTLLVHCGLPVKQTSPDSQVPDRGWAAWTCRRAEQPQRLENTTWKEVLLRGPS